MSENTEEKFGRIFYDGRLVDLNNMSIEEIEKVIEDLEAKNKELENQIDKILGVDD